jgi:hypothetical protein
MKFFLICLTVHFALQLVIGITSADAWLAVGSGLWLMALALNWLNWRLEANK